VKLRILIVGLVLVAVTALGQNLPDLGDVSQSELSPIQERRLGESIMREIRADRTYSDDAEVTDYLNALGYRLVSASPEPAQQFNFFLILDPQVNAFALPGGFIGVNSGLLLASQSESEVASVLGHEIAHVTQHHIARMLVQQKQSTVGSLAALAVALLASRVNSQAAQAAAIASQAGAVQSMLNFTRSNEQEADRVGFQILDRGGFDPHAMPVFFERLQRATRIYETSAPAYLRTHPLTYERIADMEGRAESMPYRQVPDGLEFQLIRAKLKAALDTPQESVAFFEESLREKKYLSEAASRYGLVAALLRAKSYARARQELQSLRKIVHASPIVETLAGQLSIAAGDMDTAQQLYRTALQNYPGYRALIYDYADLLLRNRQPEAALKVVEARLQNARSDNRLYELQARGYAALDKRTLQHRAQAEAYYRQGDLQGAVEQLALAQKAGDGDFYQQSSVDARLRELRAQLNEQRREREKK
jgi:predicted Zn-dependent protease